MGNKEETIKEETVLVRFIDTGKLIWIREISRIKSLGLSAILTKELQQFWHSQDEILYLTSEGGTQAPEIVKIVAERIRGRRCLFIFGAGHVGRSIALMGTMIGLEIALIDDRQEFLAKDKLPDCDIRLLSVNFNHIGDSIMLNRESAVVIVTRGHQYDETILKQIANHEVGYIGMIGSRRRVAGVFRRLRQEGISESFLSSVKAPIGLEIGAKSPQEIAVAVHAEIIKHFSGIDVSANL
ncbi:MAG: xanthine dehydrogenase accessory factor [Blastocatellia bacterium]